MQNSANRGGLRVGGSWEDSHQQAGFTAGTVANNDELSADFGHDLRTRWVGMMEDWVLPVEI